MVGIRWYTGRRRRVWGELRVEIEVLKGECRVELDATQRTRKEATMRELARQLIKKIGRGR